MELTINNSIILHRSIGLKILNGCSMKTTYQIYIKFIVHIEWVIKTLYIKFQVILKLL